MIITFVIYRLQALMQVLIYFTMIARYLLDILSTICAALAVLYIKFLIKHHFFLTKSHT